ncbi:Cytochrome c oxidase assembly protein cox11, mitochondrial [Podospora pseudoanserina]|uniref:Cytochrome c oxidase assembly protein cox11, mitochondrial n=1 Tax=Podospora pseudoanserina TaxID=2609844 RepID=A0ABR0IER0_9PEZI|nr:Cytochrome c oxidase assembly protein cox11, mitochondrial [Podospora pseudoanserina]
MSKTHDDDDGFMGECLLKQPRVSPKKEGAMTTTHPCTPLLRNRQARNTHKLQARLGFAAIQLGFFFEKSIIRRSSTPTNTHGHHHSVTPNMNSIPRITRRLAATSQKRFFTPNTPRRAKPQQHPHYHQPTPSGSKSSNPEMDRIHQLYRQRNRSTAFYTISVILGTVALSYGSVPMYKMICQTTGWGGQPVRAHGGSSSSSSPDEDITAKLIPITTSPRIRVSFSASVSDLLDWKFVPQQREVRVLPGETALAFYTATNNSDKDIIGVATYSVTPAQVAPYFSKIQCFCFEEQRLQAGETVDMPVFFYLDPDLLNDLNMRGVESVVLNYTFFKARYDDQK